MGVDCFDGHWLDVRRVTGATCRETRRKGQGDKRPAEAGTGGHHVDVRVESGDARAAGFVVSIDVKRE
jgi:hypothetical protein